MSVLADLRDWWRLGDSATPVVENAASVPLGLVARGSDVWEAFTGGIGGTAGLPAVTERSVMGITAVYACVNLRAGAIASLPINIFSQQKDGERSKLEDDPLWRILNVEFSPRWLASAGWEFMEMSRCFHGDAFAKILRTGSRVIGLLPIHPRRVRVAPWADGTRLAYEVMPEFWMTDTKPEILDQDDMLHVPSFGFDGIRSLSPLQHALKQAGGVALAAQEFSGQFFANSARPDYALSAPAGTEMTAAQVEDLRAQINEKHSRAAGNLFRPMLLQGGLKFESLQLTNEDAELIATRGFQIEENCRAFGVPPVMVGHTEKTSNFGTGVAERGGLFVRYCLRPHLNAYQNEVSRKLLRGPDRVAEFDTFELERGDMKGMFEAFRMAIGRAGEPGFLTTDEVRKYIHRNRVPGGDLLNPGIPGNGATNAQPPA